MRRASCCKDGEFYIQEGVVARETQQKEWLLVGGATYSVKFCPFCGQFPGGPTPDLVSPGHTLRIVFDVDGVICDHSGMKLYQYRDPYPHAVKMLRKLKAEGHTIVLQTARYMKQTDGDQEESDIRGRVQLMAWLKHHDIPCDEIFFGKSSADIYVDDRACRVESDKGMIDWAETFLPLLRRIQASKGT